MPYLLSWLGLDDLKASRGESGVRGPLFEALNALEDDTRVVLLNHHSPAAGEAFKKSVAAKDVTIRTHALKTIFDFRDIHQAVVHEVDVIRKADRLAGFRFFLNSGTPPMQTIWILLGKSRYRAELVAWNTVEKRLDQIDVPFEITADFIRDQTSAVLSRSSLEPVPGPTGFSGLVGKCSRMNDVIDRAKVVAGLDVPVLLEGESGTGKELLAKAIHDASPTRKNGPFIAVNCGAIPEALVEGELFGSVKGAFTGSENRTGHFRHAKGGTLFLDEIGELPLAAQVSLLRPLQEKKVVPVGQSKAIDVDVRIIAATHRSLVKDVAARRFREDLFYRLAVAVLQMPALREREGDVDLLTDHLMIGINKNLRGVRSERQLNTDARKLLAAHDWPGNIRELGNTLWRAALWSTSDVLGPQEIRTAMLGPHDARTGPLAGGYSLKEALRQVESAAITQALAQAAQKKKVAAGLLGISHQVLATRRRKLGL